MSELAITHLKQARGFARAGNPLKAVELLEKARVLVRNDADLMARVLEQLADSYDAVGRSEQASRCRAQLSRLAPPPPPMSHAPIMAPPPRMGAARRVSPWLIFGIPSAILLIVVIATTVALWPAPRSADISYSFIPPLVPQLPTTQPAPPTTLPAPPHPAAPAAVAPPAALVPSHEDRQELLKDSVGLIVVVLHYEGPYNNQHAKIDLPLATGTTFAITSSGLILTNKHVVEAANEIKVPPSLQQYRLPTLTLRSTSFVVCFGPDPSDRHVAKLLHKSDQFDLAVLRIDRHFDRPLALATKELRQGDDILVCGFPGAVMAAMNEASNTPAHIIDVSRKWQTARQIDAFDEFSPDSYNSTLTKGIVSAPERNVKGVSYMQIDAAISPGNSGGPVLNQDNQVVGIATWGLRSPTPGEIGASYNFALLLGQVQSELEPYMKD